MVIGNYVNVKERMLKLLYDLFPNQFNKLAFSSQSKPPDFSSLETKFIDSNGHKYYQFKEDFDIPILRKGKLEQLIIELSSKVSGDELDMFLEQMEKCLAAGTTTEMAKIGWLVYEMKKRKELLFHPDIMMEIACVLYIREDENPAVVDEEIHRYKFEQFKKDSQGGLWVFFYTAGLNRYLPFLEKSKKDWMKYWKDAEIEVKELKEMLSKMNQDGKNHLSEESSNSETPSKKN